MNDAPDVFFEHVLRDPLFAAEGMDLERGEAALSSIEAIMAEVEEAIGKGSVQHRLFLRRYPLMKYVVPASFLRSLIESERERRRFLGYPTLAAGERLVRAWEKAGRAFEQDVARFVTMNKVLYRIDRLAGTAGPIQDAHGNITEPGEINRQIGLFQKNAAVLKEEIAARRRELAEGVAAPAARTEQSPLQEYKEGRISERQKYLHDLDLAYGLPHRHGTILERFGPLEYTLTQFDGKPTTHTFMVYVIRNKQTGVTAVKVNVIDVRLFIPIIDPSNTADKKQKNMTFHAMLVGVIPFWRQDATNLYTSRDVKYWADIASLVDLKRRPSLNRHLVETQRSSMLDLLLGACREDHEILRGHMRERVRLAGRVSYFWNWINVRGHSGIYYVPFNKSVWRIPEEINLLGAGRASAENRPYVNEEYVVARTTPEIFERIMRGGSIREQARRDKGLLL